MLHNKFYKFTLYCLILANAIYGFAGFRIIFEIFDGTISKSWPAIGISMIFIIPSIFGFVCIHKTIKYLKLVDKG